MKKICEECMYETEDPNEVLCPRCDTHPPLIVLEDGGGRKEEPPPRPPEPALNRAATWGDTKVLVAELEALHRDRKRPLIIGLMGFSTTGKTWLLNRLKDELGTECLCQPPLEKYRDEDVRSTEGAHLHKFLYQGDPKHTFFLVDIEGELFRQEMETGFTGAANQDVLSILHLCTAFLFVIPAAEFLFTKDLAVSNSLLPAWSTQGLDAERVTVSNRTRQGHIERMNETLALMAAVVKILEVRGGAGAAMEGGPLTDKDINDTFEAGRRCAKPAALILTMADRMQEVLDSLPHVDPALKAGGPLQYDQDPIGLVLHYRPSIVDRMRRSFRWWRIDFAAAFAGHQGSTKPSYDDHDHAGVLSLIRWFRFASSEIRNPLLWLAGGSAAAIDARRRLRPAFGRLWKEKLARKG